MVLCTALNRSLDVAYGLFNSSNACCRCAICALPSCVLRLELMRVKPHETVAIMSQLFTRSLLRCEFLRLHFQAFGPGALLRLQSIALLLIR
jgi:hypothetical protein